jgi:serine/threonine protein kinase
MHINGLAHRDMKLENCFINQDVVVKIGDFGTHGNFHMKKLKSKLGSLAYCPSEIIDNNNKRPYSGPPVDIFACGVILYVMLTQKFPFSRVGGK